MELSAPETRVLGCLLEKQRTTPDAYPLSLNALRLACNQSTNRDPVVDYDDAVIRDALHRLERRGLTRLASGAGSRAAKYRHLLAEALPLERDEQAVVCVLMLRGAQTPGELKQRCERMHAFADLASVHETLGRLIDRELVARLDRRPGHKEERYAHQLGGDGESEAGREASIGDGQAVQAGREASIGDRQVVQAAPGAVASAGVDAGEVRLSEPGGRAEHENLHERVAKLERDVADLRAELQARMRHPV